MNSLKNFLSYLLFAGVLLVIVSFIRPALADPIAEKSPQYTEITQAIETLHQAQADPAAAGYSAEQLTQQLSTLQFQKYIMENTEDWGICRNNTTATIGVYGYDPDKKTATPELAYVGPGQQTDDDWACTGVYLPGDAQVTGFDLKGEPAIAEIVDGTHITISQNPDTQALEFDVPIYRVRQGADLTQPLPQLTQAEVAAATPNAPID